MTYAVCATRCGRIRSESVSGPAGSRETAVRVSGVSSSSTGAGSSGSSPPVGVSARTRRAPESCAMYRRRSAGYAASMGR